MTQPLSVLDLSPVDAGSTGPRALRNTLDLARTADRLGYTRFWLAEHHNTAAVASSAPEIMIGQVAQATTRVRVGSGGIMLPNHAPLQVAEDFRVLEALFPGRIDLGIGRAPGTDQVTAVALRRSVEALGADDFPAQLAELRSYAGGGFPADHPFRSVVAAPADVPLPPVWILGSSLYGAQVAAALGLGFAFAAHINPDAAVPALRAYRDAFRRSGGLAAPHAILAVSVVCAPTAAEAERRATTLDLVFLGLRRGDLGPLPSPEQAAAHPWTPEERAAARTARALRVVGDPDGVRARLLAMVEATGADEVMVTSMVHGHTARQESLELLAGAFALPGGSGDSRRSSHPQAAPRLSPARRGSCPTVRGVDVREDGGQDGGRPSTTRAP